MVLLDDVVEVFDLRHVPPANVPNLPLSDHRHPLVAGQRSARGWQATEAETRPDQALHAPMVLLNDVVQVFDLAQPGEAPQLTIALHGSALPIDTFIADPSCRISLAAFV